MNAIYEDFARARDALRRAMDLVRSMTRPDLPFEVKAGGGPVTAVDRAVDGRLRTTLPTRGDGWLSEESDDDLARLHCRRVWIVDPLDGTRSFLAGRPDHAVSIALVIDGRPVLGAIGAPAADVTVIGGERHRVEVTGDPGLPWPPADDLLRVLASRSETKRGEWTPWANGRCHLLPVGSVAYKLALVAGGFADATWTLNGKHEWDVAAGAALVTALGGDVWLPLGGDLRWNRRRPRFASFAAAANGRRGAVDEMLRSARG